MSLMRWDPFSEVMPLRQMVDRLMEDAFVQTGRVAGDPQAAGLGVALDMLEDEDELVVKATLPGVKPEDVDISVHGDMLTIQGEVREEHESRPSPRATAGRQVEEAGQQRGQQAQVQPAQGQRPQQRDQPQYHYRERRYGRFTRQVMLPIPVDSNQAEATFEHGILTIRLPKAEQAKRRWIQISGGDTNRPAIEGQQTQHGGATGSAGAQGGGARASGAAGTQR